MKLKKAWAFVPAAAVLLTSACGGAEVSVPPPSVTEAYVRVDPSVIRPQDDFYGYVNAGYLLDNLPEYGSSSSGSFAEVSRQTEDELFGLLDEICESSAEYAPGSPR